MMRPPRSFRWRNAAWLVNTVPIRLMLSTVAESSGERLSAGPPRSIPATWASTSSRPSQDTASPTARSTSSVRDTSQLM